MCAFSQNALPYSAAKSISVRIDSDAESLHAVYIIVTSKKGRCWLFAIPKTSSDKPTFESCLQVCHVEYNFKCECSFCRDSNYGVPFIGDSSSEHSGFNRRRSRPLRRL